MGLFLAFFLLYVAIAVIIITKNQGIFSFKLLGVMLVASVILLIFELFTIAIALIILAPIFGFFNKK